VFGEARALRDHYKYLSREVPHTKVLRVEHLNLVPQTENPHTPSHTPLWKNTIVLHVSCAVLSQSHAPGSTGLHM